MAKINTPEELRLMREKLRADLEIRENSNTPDELPQIRVSMDECGIAAGAKAVLATFFEELAARPGHRNPDRLRRTLQGRTHRRNHAAGPQAGSLRPCHCRARRGARRAANRPGRNGRRPDRSINCVRQSENFRKEATGPTVEPGI